MSKKRRRKLRPHERARQDQATAAARDYGAAASSTALVTVAYADPGTQCCWCDCPDSPDSRHYQPGYVCDGCQREAVVIAHVLHGTRDQLDFPVCEEHQENLAATTARWVRSQFGPIPIEVQSYSVLDEDQGGGPR